MSIIFGVYKPKSASVETEEMQLLASATAMHATDGSYLAVSGRMGMGFQPYHTHIRSKLETGPMTDAHGNMVDFDGRLDNWEDLRRSLQLPDQNARDSSIVLAAYLRWGERCFAKLLGDWALVLWAPSRNVVYLARDHAGTRTLYFRNEGGTLRWSTYLETFFAGGVTCSIDGEYSACYLSSQPTRCLTPYKGIRAVLPAHYVAAREGTSTHHPHWQWMATGRIRYRSDEEYEQHFLALFKQSVQRRTGAGAPVLAQLSGGMDSTSIVCISDALRKAQGCSAAELLDTISYYDDTEPNWNERPFFSLVEARREKVGIHVDISTHRSFQLPQRLTSLLIFPGADSTTLHQEQLIQEHIGDTGCRVILSGTGGDQLLGGVPTALPELADYLVTGRIVPLFKRSIAWCIADRTPLVHQLLETATFAIDHHRPPRMGWARTSPWLTPEIQGICAKLRIKDIAGKSRFSLLPSVLSNGRTWWSVIDSLPHTIPSPLTRYEYRYPYLDRDLVDFLFRIPPEQLLRPGRRRSLMRRALKNIVPNEILERRRKSYILHGPLHALQGARDVIRALLAEPLIAEYGLIDPIKLRRKAEVITSGTDTAHWPLLAKAIQLELWMRSITGGRKRLEHDKELPKFAPVLKGAKGICAYQFTA
jgi:asparagine synthase (glutamine-hydrolysing)